MTLNRWMVIISGYLIIWFITLSINWLSYLRWNMKCKTYWHNTSWHYAKIQNPEVERRLGIGKNMGIGISLAFGDFTLSFLEKGPIGGSTHESGRLTLPAFPLRNCTQRVALRLMRCLWFSCRETSMAQQPKCRNSVLYKSRVQQAEGRYKCHCQQAEATQKSQRLWKSRIVASLGIAGPGIFPINQELFPCLVVETAESSKLCVWICILSLQWGARLLDQLLHQVWSLGANISFEAGRGILKRSLSPVYKIKQTNNENCNSFLPDPVGSWLQTFARESVRLRLLGGLPGWHQGALQGWHQRGLG